MDPITTGSGGGRGRRGHRPIEHAGEVAKKKNAQPAEKAEPPPAFTTRKIGGATDILSHRFDITADDGVDQSEDWREAGGVSIENFQPSRSDIHEGVHPHPLADQPGCRRVWVSLTVDQMRAWKGLDDTSISNFCKSCFDGEDICSHPRHMIKDLSRQWKCHSCDISRRNCLHLVSYKAPASGISVNGMLSRMVMELERAREMNIGTLLEVPVNGSLHSPQWVRRVNGIPTGARPHSSSRPQPTHGLRRDDDDHEFYWTQDSEQLSEFAWSTSTPKHVNPGHFFPIDSPAGRDFLARNPGWHLDKSGESISRNDGKKWIT